MHPDDDANWKWFTASSYVEEARRVLEERYGREHEKVQPGCDEAMLFWQRVLETLMCSDSSDRLLTAPCDGNRQVVTPYELALRPPHFKRDKFCFCLE